MREVDLAAQARASWCSPWSMAQPSQPGCCIGKDSTENRLENSHCDSSCVVMSGRYPLRLVYIPKCVADSSIDCPWVVSDAADSRSLPSQTHQADPLGLSSWQYMLSYGGGLLGGDTVEMTCDVGEGCTAALTTQVRPEDQASSLVHRKPVANLLL